MADVVVAAISNQSIWDAEFAWSLVCLGRDNVLDILRVSGQTIAQMRNRVAEKAIKRGASHILMLDCDQVYPPDTIERLLEHDVDIVGGIYPARRKPWYLNIHLRSDIKKIEEEVEAEAQDEGAYAASRVNHMPAKGLLKVDVLGLGGALIKAEVFEKLKQPFFDSPAVKARDKNGDYVEDHTAIIGDEFYFAKNCRENGVEMYCDTSLQYVHMISTGVVYDHRVGVKYVSPRQ